MKKKIVVIGVFLCTCVLAAFAIDSLLPNDSTPLQIVVARKAAMQGNNALSGDARAKLAAGTIKAISADAKGMIAISAMLPHVFTDTYSSAYPVGTSKLYFKGGAVAGFRDAAQVLLSAAEDLVKFADAEDKPNTEAQIAKLGAACGACHAVFRGQLQ
jgi:hypothetical protein